MKLAEDMAYHKHDDPACQHLSPFIAENSGPLGMVMAARDLLAGRTVVFALCECDSLGWEIKEIIRMAVPEGLRVVRYWGKGGPMGAGSHTVHGSGSIDNKGEYDYDDVPLLTACVCMAVCRSGVMSTRIKEDV